MIGRTQAELDRQRLEAEIASLQSEIEDTASRISASDMCSLGSLSTHAKRVVVRRVVRKVRPKSAPSASAPLTPVNESPQAVQDARTAEQHRMHLEREIAAMEEAIASHRRSQLKKIVTSSSRNLSNHGSAQLPPLPHPSSHISTAGGRSSLDVAHDEQPLTVRKNSEECTGPTVVAATTMTNVSASSSHGSRPPVNFLDSIAQAASAREHRLESGEAVHRDHIPEVEAPKATTPQLSFDLAELVSKAARDREHRLDSGGETKMRDVPKREELKDEYKSIVVEAAQLGRLTRLREHVVEATAFEKTPEQEWRSQGLLAIQWRSNHMSVIHQAAQAGAASKLPEKVTTNFTDERLEQENAWEQDQDNELESQVLSPRMRQLLELNQRVGSGQHKVDHMVLGRKEERGVDCLIVKPMWCYSNVDDVVLPKASTPKINLEQKRRELAKRPMVDISNEAATRAWERRARLDRPNIMPKIKEQCTCCWCQTASPFQTYAYKVKEMRHKHGNDVEDSLAIMHHHDMERRDRERRKADRLRRQARQYDDETEWNLSGGGCDQRENGSEQMVLSNMPTAMLEKGFASAAARSDDDNFSLYSGMVSTDQSIASTDSRAGSTRVVRKVRKVRRAPKLSHDSVDESSSLLNERSTQLLDPVIETTVPGRTDPSGDAPPEAAPAVAIASTSKPVDTPCACVIL